MISFEVAADEMEMLFLLNLSKRGEVIQINVEHSIWQVIFQQMNGKQAFIFCIPEEQNIPRQQ